MNLDYLVTFKELAQLKNFSEVALKLGVSQPAVSFQIQKLEQAFDIRLINRTQKAIGLTAAGSRLLEFIESLESNLALLNTDFERMRQDISGELSVVASTIPSEFLLPPLLSKFKRMHSSVQIKVHTCDSLTAIRDVLNGEYEVGFCGVRPEGVGLESFRIADDEIVLIVHPEHPFAKRSWVAFPEIEGEPLISRNETSGTQLSLESTQSGSKGKPIKLKPHLVLGSTQAVISAVEAGSGIAFVSRSAISNSLALGLIRQVRVKGFSLKRNFYCFYVDGRVVSRLIREFISFIRSESSGHND